MKPLFKNVTTYTPKNYNKFINFHSNKYSRSYFAYTLLFAIMIIYCLIVNIIHKNVLLVFMFILILIVFLICRTYIPAYRYNKNKKKCTNGKNMTFSFAFYKYYYTVNKHRFYYFKLHKIFETEEFFYLYVDNENASLLEKSGFVIGSSEQFSEFIKKKCMLKYSKEKKQKHS